MTRLLLIRHGIAEDPRPGRPDSDRALTAEGWEKTRAAMRGLLGRGHHPVLGVSSPFRRAVETLRCLEEATPGGLRTFQWEGLEPDGSCGVAEAWLMGQLIEAKPSGVIALVSHQPFLSDFIHHLTGAEVDMRKASCAVLNWEDGQFELEGYYAPAELRGMA